MMKMWMMRIVASVFAAMICLGYGLSAVAAAVGEFSWDGRLVARGDYSMNKEWAPPKMMGKDFWLLLNIPFHSPKYMNSAVKDEPVFKESGLLVYAPIFEKVSVFSRLALREIEVYGPDRKGNFASEAVLEASATDAKVRYPERAIDGDSSGYNAAFSEPVKQGGESQAGSFTLTFKEPVRINRIVLRHGYWNGKEYEYIPSSFSLEFKGCDGEEWREIPGTGTEGNILERNEFTFPAVAVSCVRLSIKGVRMEMEASIAPVERALRRIAPYVDLAKTPFAVVPSLGEGKFHRVNLSTLGIKADMDSYASWRVKYGRAFLGFFPGEWNNDFNICANWTGAGESFRKLNGMTVFIPKPATREEAIGFMKKHFQARRELYFSDCVDFDSYYNWIHYAMEWGNGMVCMETSGDGNPSHQGQIASVRGAARQYGKPWGVYMAYFWGYIQNPPQAHPCGIGPARQPPPFAQSLYGGISISLAKRDCYLAFLNGASFMAHEDFPAAFFQPEKEGDYDGVWKLSPHGEALKELHAFTKRCSDRGVSYAPIALLIDYLHGWSPNGVPGAKQSTTFYCFPMRPADHMTTAFMYTIFPWFPDRKDNDSRLSNSPYGDIYDVLVANPPSGRLALSNYKAAILLGDIRIDAALADKLSAYVKAGGALVVNTRQAAKLPPELLGAQPTGEIKICGANLKSKLDGESFTLDGGKAVYELDGVTLTTAKPILVDDAGQAVMALNRYGAGTVVLSTPRWLVEKDIKYGEKKSPLVGFLLKHLSADVLPLRVEGDIEYGLNKFDDGWLVYLINNKGVYKSAVGKAELNPKEAAPVSVLLEKAPKTVSELREDKAVSWTAKGRGVSIDLVVPPGDIRILKITGDVTP